MTLCTGDITVLYAPTQGEWCASDQCVIKVRIYADLENMGEELYTKIRDIFREELKPENSYLI